MVKKDKDYFKSLAHQCMFDFTDEEYSRVESTFEVLDRQMELLDVIDTTGVDPMIFPFEAETSYLREDVVDCVISQDDALKNAKRVNNKYISVPKVVK
ncbi:MAG: Asp-tRNA(Asn)/Glu-tRNA(Gln) amidotransferase subunit GatC [Anaerorhabdus sp.]